MLGRAATVIADDTARMGFVDHDARAVLLGHGDHLRQVDDVAVHRIDAVGDDQLAVVGLIRIAQGTGEVLHVVVPEPLRLAAG
jgi:hypothetical protein